MKCDAEEYDDPDNIDIRLETYEDSPLKRDLAKKLSLRLNHDEDYHYITRVLDKRLNALLEDPNFLLLYVPKSGTKMRIVRPAKDPYHRMRMIKRINEAKLIPSFYYALSHLWRITENNRHLWHEIGDYVDDENGKPVDPVSMREEKRDTLLRMLEDSPDSYWWIDVLCARSDTPLDIMGDIYACCLECISMVDCEPSLIPLLHTMVSVEDDFPWSSIWNMMTTAIGGLPAYKQLYDKKHPHLVERLFDFMKSEWWQRVWTWQEMALPFGDVRLMAEKGTHRNTITLNYLTDSYYSTVASMKFYVEFCRDAGPSASLRNVEAVYDWLNTVHSARSFTKTRIKSKNALVLKFLMDTLGTSTRRCMNPVDYVYGVLGMLQIKIPRMQGPNAVWQSFLREIENYINGDIEQRCGTIVISDRAHQVNLQEVEHMGDVYKDLLTIVTGYPDLDKCRYPPSASDRC